MWHNVLDELASGQKRTHWMWFVFPQEPGLGKSEMSRHYALSKCEARLYVQDHVLNMRLRTVTRFVMYWVLEGWSLEEIFGPVDANKFRSCMDLFYAVTGDELYDWDVPPGANLVKVGR